MSAESLSLLRSWLSTAPTGATLSLDRETLGALVEEVERCHEAVNIADGGRVEAEASRNEWRDLHDRAEALRSAARVEVDALRADLARVTRESESRRKALEQKAEELRKEWKRAENAEAECQRKDEALRYVEFALENHPAGVRREVKRLNAYWRSLITDINAVRAKARAALPSPVSPPEGEVDGELEAVRRALDAAGVDPSLPLFHRVQRLWDEVERLRRDLDATEATGRGYEMKIVALEQELRRAKREVSP